MPVDPGFALSLAVLVAAIYLVVLRLIDVNEREPLWGLALALLVGAVGAAVRGDHRRRGRGGDRRPRNAAAGGAGRGARRGVPAALAVPGVRARQRAVGWSGRRAPLDRAAFAGGDRRGDADARAARRAPGD